MIIVKYSNEKNIQKLYLFLLYIKICILFALFFSNVFTLIIDYLHLANIINKKVECVKHLPVMIIDANFY